MNKILGVADDAGGLPCLRVAVTAPPEGGKANAALIKLMSRTLKLAKSRISITSGETSRNKMLMLDVTDPAELERITEWGTQTE